MPMMMAQPKQIWMPVTTPMSRRANRGCERGSGATIVMRMRVRAHCSSTVRWFVSNAFGCDNGLVFAKGCVKECLVLLFPLPLRGPDRIPQSPSAEYLQHDVVDPRQESVLRCQTHPAAAAQGFGELKRRKTSVFSCLMQAVAADSRTWAVSLLLQRERRLSAHSSSVAT
jgi:hypothetical protein